MTFRGFGGSACGYNTKPPAPIAFMVGAILLAACLCTFFARYVRGEDRKRDAAIEVSSRRAYKEAVLLSQEQWKVVRCQPVSVSGWCRDCTNVQYDMLLENSDGTLRLPLRVGRDDLWYPVLHAVKPGDQVQFELLSYSKNDSLRWGDEDGLVRFLIPHVHGVKDIY